MFVDRVLLCDQGWPWEPHNHISPNTILGIWSINLSKILVRNFVLKFISLYIRCWLYLALTSNHKSTLSCIIIFTYFWSFSIQTCLHSNKMITFLPLITHIFKMTAACFSWIYFYICTCVFVYVCRGVGTYWSHGAGLTGHCEPHSVGAGRQAGIRWKSSEYSWSLSLFPTPLT